jgi:alkylglycerol monooxygenase
LSQLSGVLSALMGVGIYVLVFDAVSFATVLPSPEFWNSAIGWVVALLFYDLCYYWNHRAGHRVALFWAAHVVHHQSQHYNLTTALRQTSSGMFFGWIFYVPMALAGVPPFVFAIVAIIDLLYQFWVHTEQVGKLGWFDRVFCSPSNHRVHHAVNDPYIDKNYGGILVVWANLEVYWALAKDSWHTKSWADKVRVWFKPPGWQPADLARSNPKPAFRLDTLTTYNPPLSPAGQWFASLQFLGAVGAVSLGLFMQGRLAMLEVLTIECAVIATLGSIGMLDHPMLFKPLTMMTAIIFIAVRARSTGAWDRFDVQPQGAGSRAGRAGRGLWHVQRGVGRLGRPCVEDCGGGICGRDLAHGGAGHWPGNRIGRRSLALGGFGGLCVHGERLAHCHSQVRNSRAPVLVLDTGHLLWGADSDCSQCQTCISSEPPHRSTTL